MKGSGNHFAGKEVGQGMVHEPQTTIPRGQKGQGISAGVKDGLSEHMKLGEHNPISYSLERNPVTGNTLGRVTANPVVTSAKSKGKSFTIK